MVQKIDREIDGLVGESVDSASRLASIRRQASLAAQNARLRSEYAVVRNELERVETRLDALLAMGERKLKPATVEPRAAKPHDAAFVLMCSDWHVGETVSKESVSGRNEYSPTIASRRVDKLIEGALWMLEAWRAGKRGYGWNVDTMVVWLGGDLMSGHIHDDLVQSNALSPTQELLLAESLIVRLLETFAAKAGVKRIVCPTSWGNHGRTTPDRRVSTGWSTSYEWLLYQQLANRYSSHRSIEIRTQQDEISRLDVCGKRLRFNHGDTFGYQGGVGGITIPARKWLAKLDATERADLTCIGHWHSYLDIGDLLVNGSLIGWGAYSQRVAPYAPAAQVCCLIDRKWGKRMSTEIIVQ